MDLLNVGPEVVHMLELLVSAIGMLTPDRFTTLLRPLPFDQMMVIEVVVHDGRTTILKGALFKGESLVADATRTLCCLHEERESVGAG